MDTIQDFVNSLTEVSIEIKVLLICVSFMYGAIIGSFLNVCVIRIPRGESIITPPSHCACGHKIPWYDNIPIISWIILGGKARCCKAKISVKYPLIEILMACIWCAGMLTLITIGYPWGILVALFLICGMPILTYYILVKYKLFTEH